MNLDLPPVLKNFMSAGLTNSRWTIFVLFAFFLIPLTSNAQTTNVTLCVDLSCFTSVTAPSIGGAFNGWCFGCDFMSDPDGDGTYCGTVAMLPGDQEYKFFFQEEGQEDMTPGDPCTVTNFGFTNRVVTVVDGMTQMLTYGWEVCGATCIPPPASTDITLCVDLSCFPSATAPSVFGAFNGWNAGANPITDPDGDGIYCATVGMLPGDQEYKFFFQEEGEETMTPGDICTVTNFGFTNRVVTVVDGMTQMLTYGWEVCGATCIPPPATTDITLCVDLSCFPSATAPSVFGAFNGWNAGANPITDPDGDGIYCATVGMLPGDQEYKFFFQEEGEETMTPGDICTVTNFGFTNRLVTVVDGMTQMLTYGWEVCGATCIPPPATTDITLCVDLSCFPSATAPSVFGAFNGWNAGANPITDPDGDGIYCATVGMLPGDQEYKFFFQEEGEETMTPGDPCTVTNFGFTNRVVTVVDGVTQMLTYGWEVCGVSCSSPPATTDIELCIDLSCVPSVTAPSIFGTFNGWCANCTPITDPDGDGVYCATIAFLPGDHEYKFFYQEEGEEVLTPGDPCTVSNFGFTNRVVTVFEGVTQMLTYGWEDCGAVCIPSLAAPECPITFENGATIDYDLFDFGGAISMIAPDPVDPTNTVVCTNKTTGAATFAGTVIGNGGLANPFPFGPNQQKISVRVWSPAAGIPVLLKVENSSNGGIASEVLVNTTVAMMWETLVFDFSMGNPPISLGNVYDKVVIFFNFGNIGSNQIYYFDDIMCCPAPIVALTCPPTLMVDGCSTTDAPPYADLAELLANGGIAVDADPNSFVLLSEMETATCPLTLVRTYEVSDLCLNTATCTQTVIITDNEAPVVTCADFTATYDGCPGPLGPNTPNGVWLAIGPDLGFTAASGGSFTVPVDLAGCVSDNCTNLADMQFTLHSSYEENRTDCSVTLVNEFSIRDMCETVAAERVITRITVQDTEAPTIVCPMDMIVECASDIVVDPNDVMGDDNCGVVVSATGPMLISGQADCPGATYQVTYTATDCGNMPAVCVQTFTVENDPPTITCPADMTVECFADINVDPMDATVVTSCGLGFNTIITGPVQIGQSDCFGTTYTYTYTTTDDCGRVAASCDQIFTIQNAGPILTCPAPITVECAEDIEVDPSDVGVVVSCGSGFTAQVFGPNVYDGTPDCPGARYVYRYLVEDDCGRISICERDIFIDNAGPTISCPGTQIVSCADEIILDLNEITSYATSCGQEVDLTSTEPVLIGGLSNCSGAVYLVEYTVTDQCGRSASCSINWQIENEAPTVTCMPDRMVDCPFELRDEQELLEVKTACELGYRVEVNISEFQHNCPGAQAAIEYTIFDDCGRSVQCIQNWELISPPFRVIPPPTVRVACIDDYTPNIDDAEVESPCGLDVVKSEIFGPLYDEDEPLCAGSVINYLYSFYDECGRMICEAQAVIIDPTAISNWPEFENQRVECDKVPDPETAVTICGQLINLRVTEEIITIPGRENYRIIRTYEGRDACGDLFTFRQIIVVICRGQDSSLGGRREGLTYNGLKMNGDLVLFPNPVISSLTVSLNFPDFEKVSTLIYSSFGEVIYRDSNSATEKKTIDVSGFGSGLYHLVVIGNDEVIRTEKFIIQR